jgi:hypothetical protein
MGYAGYVPAKLPPSKATPEQAALACVQSYESLEILGKLIYNCAVQPKEEKYRRIRLTNAQIKRLVAEVSGAVDALLTLGAAHTYLHMLAAALLAHLANPPCAQAGKSRRRSQST